MFMTMSISFKQVCTIVNWPQIAKIIQTGIHLFRFVLLPFVFIPFIPIQQIICLQNHSHMGPFGLEGHNFYGPNHFLPLQKNFARISRFCPNFAVFKKKNGGGTEPPAPTLYACAQNIHVKSFCSVLLITNILGYIVHPCSFHHLLSFTERMLRPKI